MPDDLRKDLGILLVLLALAILFFWPVTLGGKTILPADNAFAWEPWKSYAEEAGVATPHNGLLSDLYLENYAWKRFIRQSLRAGELPLWNPYVFAGVPFLAAGQHSALYPLSVLFYVLPLSQAYGWFAALHLFLAGAFTYLFARTLRIGRAGSTLASVTFMFSGFMVIRNVFPMIVAAAVWLPLILTVIERIVRRAEGGEVGLVPHIPDVALGTLSFGMGFLAGHPEMYYYIALVAGAYGAWRLVSARLSRTSWRALGSGVAALLCIAVLGLGLGTAQWLPLLNLVRQNFRGGTTTFREVLGWAYPTRRVIALLLPDFFGNPSHHSYFDPLAWKTLPVTVNALGERIDTVYWGIKNYVEGASYVGTLSLLLALVGVLCRGRKRKGFFALLAVLSLLFAFGSPLYIVIYKLPGFDQIHSPFRWIYPYTLCIAILAGMGFDMLCDHTVTDMEREKRANFPVGEWLGRRFLPQAALWGGLLLLGGLGLSLLIAEQAVALSARIMHALSLAPRAFADGRMFYAYQFRNLALFGGALFLGGLILSLRNRLPRILVILLTIAIVVAELFIIGHSFFPAVDPALVGYTTPAIEFLRQDDDLYRITSYIEGGEKTFQANAGMFYDIADVRGYDSIIPRQYVEYMCLIEEQDELKYNRIAPLSERSSLESPLLDMLNVKYVLTDKKHTIDSAGYTLAYDGEIRIYRNEDALPRAFLIDKAMVLPDAEARQEALRTLDPRQAVILEEAPPGDPTGDGPPTFRRVDAIDYGQNEITITFETPTPSFLVLGDSYFDGWLAFIRPADAADPSLEEKSLPIYRANGNFRAVRVPAGRHVVRFKYSPDEIKFGLYISFLSGIVMLLGLGLWGWRRLRARGAREDDSVARRVTKNTLLPILLSLVNKGIDMAFAMLMLRILGPADAGKYYLAVVVIGWFDIFINFGLNTLVTREVAKDRQHANRYLSNAIALRVGLWVVAIPIMALFFLTRGLTKPLDPRTMLAIGLFQVGLLPSNISASLSAVFNGYERMEIPASVTTLTTLLKVALGTAALMMNTGYVGLAAVSIVVNVITLIVLYALLRNTLFRPHAALDFGFQRRMLRISYPLMINLLLATLFFKVAIVLLEWLTGDPRVLGWYSTAYKYADAVQIIPSFFTMALFPILSRYAAEAKDSLLRAYRLAAKLLLIAAVVGALLGWALARELIAILGGSQYLPQAAHILRVMIWYMPIGFMNSLTQYVLIALNRQRFLTKAFAIGLAFNVVANVVLIRQFGYMAAAYVAVASELALFIPFYVGIRRHLTRMPWLRMAWKQGVSSLPLVLLVTLLPRRYLGLSVLGGLVCYVVGLKAVSMFDEQERALIAGILPAEAIRSAVGRLVGGRFDVKTSEK
ncbi:MAG: oligosaccharide flippase family protein [Chloroflexota bacterium]|nr:oligosaccharide flippase family protein [Chloroflexota bacterium]